MVARVTPERVTTDKARCYPPALRAVLPGAEHRRSKYRNNELERDHSHLKQRIYPMGSFKQGASADTLARGHALIRNLRRRFLDADRGAVPPNLRLAAGLEPPASPLRPPAAALRSPLPERRTPLASLPTQPQQNPGG